MKEPIAYVYAHIREDNEEVFYIGIGVKLNYARAHEKTNRNKFWKHVTNKTPYKIKILFSNLSWEKAREKEMKLIKLLGRKDLKTGTLVNLTNGGDGTYERTVTASTREKIREFQLNKTITDTFKNNCRVSAINRGVSSENRKKMIAGRLKNGWNNQKHKPLICTLTGKIFPSIKDATGYAGWSKSHLASMLRGDKPNTTTLQYQ